MATPNKRYTVLIRLEFDVRQDAELEGDKLYEYTADDWKANIKAIVEDQGLSEFLPADGKRSGRSHEVLEPPVKERTKINRNETKLTGSQTTKAVYFLFAALIFAHRARCAAAIFLRADADMVRFAGAEPVLFAGCDSFRTLAHRAFCACAILRREAADTIRAGRVASRDTPEPFKDSITEIARSSFSTSACARRRSSRSCCSAFSRFGTVAPLGI